MFRVRVDEEMPIFGRAIRSMQAAVRCFMRSAAARAVESCISIRFMRLPLSRGGTRPASGTMRQAKVERLTDL